MNDTTFQGNGNVKYVPVVVDAKPKSITNAMKIRAMTNEELAEKIGESIDCQVCKTIHHSENDECPCRPHQACEDIWLDWLKQNATKGGD